MPIDRFFLDASFEEKKSYLLDPKESHHLIKVTRHKLHDNIELIDGKGNLAVATIHSIDRHEVKVTLESILHQAPPAISFHLAIAAMRGSKLEWIVEKAVELGVSSFLFFQADRSEKEHFSDSLRKRLEFIAISAIKQSGRLYLPSFSFFPTLDLLLKSQKDHQLFYGDIAGDHDLENLTIPTLFISGPESGFSEKEKKLLQEEAKALSLSDQILRAETAPIAFSALFSFKAKRWGK